MTSMPCSCDGTWTVGRNAGSRGSANWAGAVVEVPVVYDGADLDDVAAACGITVEDVVRRHSAATYVRRQFWVRVLARSSRYLIGGDPALRLAAVPSNGHGYPPDRWRSPSEFSAVYLSASPGGWHLLDMKATLDVLERRAGACSTS